MWQGLFPPRASRTSTVESPKALALFSPEPSTAPQSQSPHAHAPRSFRRRRTRLALALASGSTPFLSFPSPLRKTSCSRQRPERSQPGPTRVASPTAQKACPSPHARRSFQFERSRTPQQPITLINIIPFHRPDISAPIQARSPISANTQAAKNASVVQMNSLAT